MLPVGKDVLPMHKEMLPVRKEVLPMRKEVLPMRKKMLPVRKEVLPVRKEVLGLGLGKEGLRTAPCHETQHSTLGVAQSKAGPGGTCGGATTTSPDVTHPRTIFQNLGGGVQPGVGGVPAGGRGGVWPGVRGRPARGEGGGLG